MRLLPLAPVAVVFALALGVLPEPPDAAGGADLAPPARASAPSADTVVAVEPGDVVVLDAREGRVVIEGVGGDLLRIQDRARRGGVEVTRRGRRIVLRARSSDGELDRTVHLGVPRGVDVEISGGDVDVEARGLDGSLRVVVVEGDLRAADVTGELELRTVDGDVEVSGAEAGVIAVTVDGRVRLRDVAGPSITAESMDGDLVLDGVEAAEVEATTVDGDVHYRGALDPGSRVRLTTHDGDVVAIVPPGASADVEVATFDGEFVPGFPVRVGRVQAGQPLRFRMGSGGARLDMQVFDGDIQLRHGPGR